MLKNHEKIPSGLTEPEWPTYSRIVRTLAQDYFSIFYVDIRTDEFVEYRFNGPNKGLEIKKNGVDFFEKSKRIIQRVVYEEDRQKTLAAWEKDSMLCTLKKDGRYSASYRIVFNGVPTYVNIKVMQMMDGDDHHIIVGVSNNDAQMRREWEYAQAQEIACRDALTGAKNKRAYVQEEQRINEAIARGEVSAFAIVVCDVNNLKQVNDTCGHKAGDQLLKDASRLICGIFKHSPVYRIGGDEFVVVLRGEDYDRRISLLGKLTEKNKKNLNLGGVIVASGISDYIAGQDKKVTAVFERADMAMYENKNLLKK